MISSATKTNDQTVKSEDTSQMGKTKGSDDLVQENEQHTRRSKLKYFHWNPHSNLTTTEVTALLPSFDSKLKMFMTHFKSRN
jgi:hypothetical protein